MAANDSNLFGVSINNFAYSLYHKQAAAKAENYFISPYSICSSLCMCLAGAKSETYNQLLKVLSLNKYKKPQDVFEAYLGLVTSLQSGLSADVQLNTANKLYSQQNYQVRSEYVETLKKYFMSQVESLNFAQSEDSAQKINKWVEQQTNEKIKDLIGPGVLDSLTRLVLVNAIYFKGNWTNQFNKEQTYKEDFTLLDGSKVKVDMMKLTGKKLSLVESPNGLPLTTCEFPYAGNKIAMTIFLPDKGVQLSDVEKKLSGETLSTLLTIGLSVKTNAFVPKFKLELKSELSKVLSELGAPLAFDKTNADFSGINDKEKDLYINKVIHQAVVEVNEEGTVAAAATASVLAVRMAVIERPIEFKCDRPFLFTIHDKTTKAILFIGKYVKP